MPSEYILKQLSRLRIALGGCTWKEVIFLFTCPLYLVVGYNLQLYISITDGEGKYGMSITPINKRALKLSCYSIVPVKRKSLHFIQKNILIPNSQGKSFSHMPPQINGIILVFQRQISHSILIPLQAQNSSNELSVRRWHETAEGIEVLEWNKSTVKNKATPPIVQPLVGR